MKRANFPRLVKILSNCDGQIRNTYKANIKEKV